MSRSAQTFALIAVTWMEYCAFAANPRPSVANICWRSLRTCRLRPASQSRSCCQTVVSGLNLGAWPGSTSFREPWAGGANPHRGQKTEAAHQRAPIRLFWNIYDASPTKAEKPTDRLCSAGCCCLEWTRPPLHSCCSSLSSLKQVPEWFTPLVC